MKQVIVQAFTVLIFLAAAHASPPPTTYYSRQAGSFNATGTWSNISHAGSPVGSAPCNCTPCSIAGNNSFEIDHAVTIGCDMTFSGNPDIHIRTGGSLTVTGNASISGAVTFVVDSGANVSVSGNFSVSGGGGYISINGSLSVGGNISINGSYPVCGDGTISYGGTLSGSGEICDDVLVLPVEWLYFEGQYVQHVVRLRWATATEIDNDYFTVQKSADGEPFSGFATVDGAGNSTTVQEYSATDFFPAHGINYYRIKQTDFNGQPDFSETIALFIHENGTGVAIAPTLVKDNSVQIFFSGLRNYRAEIMLSDITGKILKQENFSVRTDSDRMTFRVAEGLACSVYFITVSTPDFRHTEKIVVE
jgi:hypothetical protein